MVSATQILIRAFLAGTDVRGRDRRGIIAGALGESRSCKPEQRCSDDGRECKLKAHLKLSPSGMRPTPIECGAIGIASARGIISHYFRTVSRAKAARENSSW